MREDQARGEIVEVGRRLYARGRISTSRATSPAGSRLVTPIRRVTRVIFATCSSASILSQARYRLSPTVSAPWLASSSACASHTAAPTLSASSAVDGVP